MTHRPTRIAALAVLVATFLAAHLAVIIVRRVCLPFSHVIDLGTLMADADDGVVRRRNLARDFQLRDRAPLELAECEMNALLNWFAAVRWRMALSHCLEGLLIQIPLGLLFDFRVGALGVVVWYWSRKKLEMELESLQPEESAAFSSHAYTWAIGWFPWQWDAYKMMDVALPTISSSLVALAALSYRGPFSPI